MKRLNEKQRFAFTKVVTKNFVIDWLQGIRNMLGMELSGYEDAINDGTHDLMVKMEKKYQEISWFRFSINELTNGGIMITLFGEGKLNGD